LWFWLKIEVIPVLISAHYFVNMWARDKIHSNLKFIRKGLNIKYKFIPISYLVQKLLHNFEIILFLKMTLKESKFLKKWWKVGSKSLSILSNLMYLLNCIFWYSVKGFNLQTLSSSHSLIFKPQPTLGLI
jgi:hypothetical protein